MRVRFLADYRGVLTDETFYHAGDVAEFGGGIGAALVEAGRVSPVIPPKRRAPAKKAPARKRRVKGVI